MHNIYDLIIIGGGPAAVTAGIYAARKQLNTLVVSKNFKGQVQWAVSVKNYPGFKDIAGLELAKKFEAHLREQEIKIITDEVVKIKKEYQLFELITKKEKTYMASSIIIATGCDPRPLEVSGEKEFLGQGVTYCTICDAPLFRDKTVAIIGGGNAGVIGAMEIAKYAEKV